MIKQEMIYILLPKVVENVKKKKVKTIDTEEWLSSYYDLTLLSCVTITTTP